MLDDLRELEDVLEQLLGRGDVDLLAVVLDREREPGRLLDRIREEEVELVPLRGVRLGPRPARRLLLAVIKGRAVVLLASLVPVLIALRAAEGRSRVLARDLAAWGRRRLPRGRVCVPVKPGRARRRPRALDLARH